MDNLYDILAKDVRLKDGLNACINCGICTAICPAAQFYDYDPRVICNQVQTRDDETIRSLLKSETIWYCGQCMSCKTRCPRGNTPGYIIQALRKLSQELGYFTESEKGRQQFAIKQTVGKNILELGYCFHPERVSPALHPEQGPVWKWIRENAEKVYDSLGGNYEKPGAGTLRKIDEESLDELQHIFDETGATEMYEDIQKYSEKKAKEMNLDIHDDCDNEYFYYVYSKNSEIND
jgi:heterodisulfide reductase subunit C1